MGKTFKVRDKETGETFTVREKDTQKIETVQKQNILGSVFNVPSAAIRSKIQGKGYVSGALQPDQVPRFQDLAIGAVQKSTNPVVNAVVGHPASMAGFTADFVTNPAEVLAMTAGKLPLGRGRTLGSTVSGTEPAQAFQRFMNKPRGLSNISKARVKDTRLGAEFAQSIRKRFYDFKTKAVESFGKELDAVASKNPKQVVNLDELSSRIQSEWDDLLPETQRVLKKVPIIKDLIGGAKNTNRSLQDVQAAINYYNTKIPKNIRYSNLEALDYLNDLKAAQLDAFPSMAGIRDKYRQAIEPWKQVKSQFNFNKTLKAVENNFGGPEGVEAVKKIFPKEMVSEMGGYRKAADQINKAMSSKSSIGGTLSKMVKYYLLYRFGIGAIEKVIPRE